MAIHGTPEFHSVSLLTVETRNLYVRSSILRPCQTQSRRSDRLARSQPGTVSDSSQPETSTCARSTRSFEPLTRCPNSAWVVPKDMSKLKEHEIQSYINEPHKRSGDLLAGYKIALNPVDWEKEKAIEAAEAKEKAENALVDELDDEDAQGEEDDSGKKTATKSRKRKRESEAAPKKAATKKTKESTEPSSKKRSAPNGKGKRNGVKSEATVESEDDAHEEEAGPSKKSSPPPAKKAKRDERKLHFPQSRISSAHDPLSVQRRIPRSSKLRIGDTSCRRHS